MRIIGVLQYIPMSDPETSANTFVSWPNTDATDPVNGETPLPSPFRGLVVDKKDEAEAVVFCVSFSALTLMVW